MRRFRWMVVALFAALLLSHPQAALEAAQRAMAQWYRCVAPSLFPFRALMPMLTCEEAARTCEALLGPAMRLLFDLPGAAAPALVAGLAAGSPAGAVAARRIASAGGMKRGQLRRVACCACGMSPGFLIAGLGAGLLGDPASGHVLLRAQLAAQLLLTAALRRAWRGDDAPVPVPRPTETEQPIRAAVGNVLAVAGYMTLFAALAGALGEILGPRMSDLLLCALDAPSGAQGIAALPIDGTRRLCLLGALCGFGGLCIGAQNLSALAGCGVRPRTYFAIRLAAAVLCAVFVGAQTRLSGLPCAGTASGLFEIALLLAAVSAIPALMGMRRTIT